MIDDINGPDRCVNIDQGLTTINLRGLKWLLIMVPPASVPCSLA